MSDAPLTYARIEDETRRVLARQEELTDEYAKHSDELAEAEHAYKLAYAQERARLRQERRDGKKLSIDAVDDEALIACAEEMKRYAIAKTGDSALRQALSSARSRLEVLRSLMSSHREVAG